MHTISEVCLTRYTAPLLLVVMETAAEINTKPPTCFLPGLPYRPYSPRATKMWAAALHGNGRRPLSLGLGRRVWQVGDQARCVPRKLGNETIVLLGLIPRLTVPCSVSWEGEGYMCSHPAGPGFLKKVLAHYVEDFRARSSTLQAHSLAHYFTTCSLLNR